MKDFPTVPKPVTPLYVNRSRPFNNNYTVVPTSTPPAQTATFNYKSNLKVIESTMYEPVSDRCVTSTILKQPRYSNRAGSFDRNLMDDEYQNINGYNNEKCKELTPPEKPPRRHNKVHKQYSTQRSYEADNYNSCTMKNGTGGDTAVDIDHINLEQCKKFSDATVQTSHLVPYRLRFWPRSTCDVKLSPSEKSCTALRLQCCCRVFSQWFLSQFGLTIVVVVWALLGAYAFFKTEGPRELEQSNDLAKIQKDLSVELATDLKQTVDHEKTWPNTIHKYLERHEVLLLDAVSAGFGEGGRGSIWTYPGCILFAVSLLTTLGFGAPVPRTTLGRGAAVLFSAIGIPLHFLLILNMGNLAAIKLQQLAFNSPTSDLPTSPPPRWLKWFPFLAVCTYYLLGVVLFGFVRRRSVPDSFMFPLDFTAAGGVATVNGHVRVLYAMYLEFAVTLAAVVVSLIQASASRGIVDIGLRLGILINT